MDVFLEEPNQLAMTFNCIIGAVMTLQIFFIYVTLVHTPKEMSTYKYTMMNCVVWSVLIVIHIGIVTRPVTFLPLPICLITGPAKFLNSFWGGHLQVLIGLILILNKTTSYFLCLVSHFFAFLFPVFIRRRRLRDGIMIFVAGNSFITIVLIASAYYSGLFTSKTMMTEKLLKEEIYIYSPQKYRSLQILIDNSLIIGATRQSLHCFYTMIYLVILSFEMIVGVLLMLYANVVLYLSIQTDKSSTGRKFKKRIMCLMTVRTLAPTLTYNLPAFYAVYVVQFDRDDASAFEVQWCLLLILFSPAVCCLLTVIGLKPFRKALFRAFKLKFSKHPDSEMETTSESKKLSTHTLRGSAVYNTSNLFSNTTYPIDFQNNRI